VGLSSGAVPVAAEERGPIARAVEREAARIASPTPSTRERSSRIRKDTLIGAGIGAGAGALLGGGACASGCTEGYLVFAAGGADVRQRAIGPRRRVRVRSEGRGDDADPGTDRARRR